MSREKAQRGPDPSGHKDTAMPRVPSTPPVTLKDLITVSTHLTLCRARNCSLLLPPPTQGGLQADVGGEKQRAKHAGVTHRGPYQTENVCS